MADGIERIRDALQFIPANDRATWVKMGQAVKSALGDDGFDVWESWSQQDESFEVKAARNVWKSIRSNGKTTIGTLFFEAKANGWVDNGMHEKPTPEQIAERRRNRAEMATLEEGRIAAERTNASRKANELWKAAGPALPDHPYLLRKRCKPVTTMREINACAVATILGYAPKCDGELLVGRLLIIPVKIGDALSTVEMIDDNGRKSALYGGAKAGGYWAAQALPSGNGPGLTLLIGEGVATTLTAKEASGHIGIAVLSSGNLTSVARGLSQRYPDAKFVILADLVKSTGEPDHHPIEAALTVGGKVAIPEFGTDRLEAWTDFNDLATHCGMHAVKRAIEGATVPIREVHPMRSVIASHDDMARGRYVTLIPATAIHPEPIEWLWNGWLAAGKFHLLGGAPGTGKTTLAIAMAATLSSGGLWPDGTIAEAGNVLIWSGEDDPANTLVPRLILSGGNRERVYFVSHTNGIGGELPFDPATDMPRLTEAAHRIGNVRLLIVDPIVSAVAGNSHNNAETRRCLQPLVDLGAALNCAVLGITHFTKGTGGSDPVERVTGSIAFAALARVVLVAAKKREPENGEASRMLARAKSNIGQDDGGFSYDLHQAELPEYRGIIASYVVWGDEIAGSAREMLATAEMADNDEGGALSDAREFLEDLLRNGPVAVKHIKRAATDAGLSDATLRRAKNALNVKAVKAGMAGGWNWQIERRCSPNPEDVHTQSMSTFGNSEYLRHPPRCNSEHGEVF